MRALARAWRQRRCRHANIVSTTSGGVSRAVCESCGHVSVTWAAEIATEVDRSSFARPAERHPRHHTD